MKNTRFTLIGFISILLMIPLLTLHAQNENALAFDGIDDNVSVASASSLVNGSNTVSMTCWAYLSNQSPSYPNFDGIAGFRDEIG